jgi:CubicO group peptidase (beta-lactamase class C family)
LAVSVKKDGNTVTAQPTGGTSPYTYAWSNGAATASQTNLTPGTYSVVVKDKVGCEKSASITISCDLALNIQKDGNKVTAQPTGGTAPYTYTWSNGATSASQSNLASGTYTVVVKDQVGCEKSASVTIEFSSTKELTSFSFNQELNDILVKGDGVIENRKVTIFLPSGTKRNALIPTFVISNKAKAFVNNVEVKTNLSTLDFSSEKVILKIVAEDQSTQEYELNLITEFPEIDNRILAYMSSMNIQGAQVAITKNEKLVYLKSYGLADKENNISVNNNSLFRIASVSKPITQAAILHLVQSGKLSLNDKVFGPDGILKTTYGSKPYSDQLKSITVRHLVEHKAGGWTNDNQDPMFLPNNLTQTEIINFVLDNRPLQHVPGSTYLYSNFGYCLLGRVIEAVTGESYENYVKKSLLIPSGISEMKLGNGTLAGRFTNEVKYYNDQFNPYSYNISRMDSHGGWISTSKDLAKLLVRIDRNTQVPDLVQKSLLDQTYFNFFNWFHMGSLPGTAAHLERLNNEFGIVILANGIGADLGKVVREGMSQRQNWPVYDLMDK